MYAIISYFLLLQVWDGGNLSCSLVLLSLCKGGEKRGWETLCTPETEEARHGLFVSFMYWLSVLCWLGTNSLAVALHTLLLIVQL